MGCTTCKQQSEAQTLEMKDGISFIPQDFAQSGLDKNIPLKIVVFIVLVLAIPIIILVLVAQIFLHFFLPKSVKNVNKKSKNFVKNIFQKLIGLRYKKELNKRATQFKDNRGYDTESELVDIEVFENEDNNEEESK